MEHFSFKVGTVAFNTFFFRDHGAVSVFPPESSVCFPVLNAEVYLAHFDKMLWQFQLLSLGLSRILWKEEEIWTFSRASPEAEDRALTLQKVRQIVIQLWQLQSGAMGLVCCKGQPTARPCEGRKEGNIPQNAEEIKWVQGKLWEILALKCRIEESPPLPTRNIVGRFVF